MKSKDMKIMCTEELHNFNIGNEAIKIVHFLVTQFNHQSKWRVAEA